MALPEGMDTLLADAMWWKFNPTAAPGAEPTFEQKQEHAQLRVKEFLLQIVREYRLHLETEAAVAQVRNQINADIAQASTAVVIEQLAE
jgi:hypothetical protein